MTHWEYLVIDTVGKDDSGALLLLDAESLQPLLTDAGARGFEVCAQTRVTLVLKRPLA